MRKIWETGHRQQDLALREDLRDFAALMEFKLRQNDHKARDGQRAPIGILYQRMLAECRELIEALASVTADDSNENDTARLEAMKEAADVANFAMLIFKRLNHGENLVLSTES